MILLQKASHISMTGLGFGCFCQSGLSIDLVGHVNNRKCPTTGTCQVFLGNVLALWLQGSFVVRALACGTLRRKPQLQACDNDIEIDYMSI